MKMTTYNGTIEVTDISNYGYLAMVTTEEGEEYYIAESYEQAGEAAREYWQDIVNNDPSEFACLVGEETLIAWALNQYAGPGTTKVRNLEEWLDLHLDCPEETFASYDGECLEATLDEELAEELGFDDIEHVVIFRHN